MLNFLPNKIIINLNVLSTFMEYWVCNNLDDCFAVTVDVRGCVNVTFSSLNKFVTQTTSAISVAKLLYFASAELLEIVVYFLDFQEIKKFSNFNK